MACVEMQPAHGDSEMEEGEIVDEVDYLSDISSEEEFLLRQRLKVLENYNNALERKEAKRTSISSGKDHGTKDALYGLSEISSTEADDNFLKTTYVITKEKKHPKPHKQKKFKQIDKDGGKNKEHRRKSSHNKKKVVSDSDASESSDDDYKNKRRKLADAVSLNIVKNDTSTLKDRLTKMLGMSKAENRNKEVPSKILVCSSVQKDGKITNEHGKEILEVNSNISRNLTNMCTEEVSQNIQDCDKSKDTVGSVAGNIKRPLDINHSEENSDEDLELLRQHALKTKTTKTKDGKAQIGKPENKTDDLSEEEDSDTEELRMICLKSRLLKKAIEIKQKQKLQKRLSNSANMHDFDICESGNALQVDNNTDIESVDMDIGSEGEDKCKDLINDCSLRHNTKKTNESERTTTIRIGREDELEEDEDLLRAKLLTSLSKNLPNLVGLNILDTTVSKEEPLKENKSSAIQTNVVEEKKFIIHLGDSDSEAEHEATQNLTKMHIKLSEQADFEHRLDLFLKSTREEVEQTKLPDVVQSPTQKPAEKFVAKTVNHLPKSEQIEYKNLVKRMAELEKIKQARQNMININNRDINLAKETLKRRNFSAAPNKLFLANKVEEKIALSRKRIAEESSKMLKLKEEAKKLSQKYKIVATELKNIATAITMNKKQQKTAQNSLTKIRNQHQLLLRSVPTEHCNTNLTFSRSVEKTAPTVKLQKNEPPSEEYKTPSALKSVKVSVVNNLHKDVQPVDPRLQVEIDNTNNKKTVKLAKTLHKEVEIKKHSPKKDYIDDFRNERIECIEDLNDERYLQIAEHRIHAADFDDYKSPLEALDCKNWEEDPNAVLCPFEFGGSCRDPDCKYLHPKIPKQD